MVLKMSTLGTIQILRNQEGWVGGVGEMITFDYGGGWVGMATRLRNHG